MSIFKKQVGSPQRGLQLLGGVMPASGSGTTVAYDWSCGMSGSTATRNSSGSFTVTLDNSNWISGSVTATLQLADDSDSNKDGWRLYLDHVYIAESSSFNVNILSGSNAERTDCPNGKISFQVMAMDVRSKNTP